MAESKTSLKAILFDFDGTLADTAPGIVATMTATFQQMGLPVPDEASMRQTIGIRLVKALQMLNGLSDEQAKKAEAVYCQLFREYEVPKVCMFPKVAETLMALADRGVRMAVVTSRDRESLELILGKYGLKGYFEEMITNDNHLTPKPSPDMVLYLLDKMNLNADEAIVVGDTTFDIEMGNAAKCRTCAVTYGNHSLELLETANPNYIIDNFDELLSIR